MNASNDRTQRVIDALTAMRAAGENITFTKVANRAGVSRWYVYKPDVRDIIAEARGYPVVEPEVNRVAKRIAQATINGQLLNVNRRIDHQRRTVKHLAGRLDWQHQEIRRLAAEVARLSQTCEQSATSEEPLPDESVSDASRGFTLGH